MCEGNGRARLSVHQSAQPGLALDNAVRDAHLAAQSRQEDDELGKQMLARQCRGEGPTQTVSETLSGLCSGLKSSYVLIHTRIQVKKFRHHCQRPLSTPQKNQRPYYLNGIHVVGDDDQLSLLALHQRGDGVHTCRQRR